MTSSNEQKPDTGIRSNLPLALALIVGIVLGFLVDRVLPIGATEQDDLNPRIASYISANPEAIENALIALNVERNQNARLQAVNLLSASDDNTIMGNPDGDITIYEFSDYNCGYCKRAFADVMEVVNADGNIRLVIKEYPILAESSVDAARLALHAANTGKFEVVHQMLMQWRGSITNAMLEDLAATHGITSFSLNDRNNDPVMAYLSRNYDLGQQLNIEGTPAFIIGGDIYPGAIGKADLMKAVEKARADAKAS
jgi:protein-disulfide isomerase